MFQHLAQWFRRATRKNSEQVKVQRQKLNRQRFFESLERRDVYAGIALPVSADLGPVTTEVSRTAVLGDAAARTKEVELFKLNVTAGTKLTAITSRPLNAVAVDTYLRLFDANGTALASDDDSAGNLYSKLTYTPKSGGVYYLGVSGYGNSSYNLATGANLLAGKTGPFNLSVATTDTQLPTLTITSTPPRLLQSSPIIAGIVADLGSGVASLQSQLDGGSWIAVPVSADGKFSYAPNLPINGSADGAHRWSLRVTDKAGNTTKSPELTFTLDTKPPTVSIQSNNSTYYGSLDVQGTIFDAGSIARLERQIDGGVFQSQYVFMDGSFSIFEPGYNFAEGAHRVTIRAIDQAGNVTVLPEINWMRDTTKPTLAVNPISEHITADAVLGGTVVDLGSGLASVQVQLDNGNFAPLTLTNGRFAFAPALKRDGSDDGAHTVVFRAVDIAGNSESARAYFKLDTQAPILTLTSAATSAVTATNLAFAGHVKDRSAYGDYYQGSEQLIVQLDGAEIPITPDSSGRFSYSTPFALNGTSDGQHQLQLRVTDRAGNRTELPAIQFVLDTQSPTLAFTETPPAMAKGNVTFRGAFLDAGGNLGTALAQLDDGPAFPLALTNGRFEYATKLPTDGSSDGLHRFRVRALDRADRESNILQAEWRIDSVAPQLSVTLPEPPFIKLVNNSPIPTTSWLSNMAADPAGFVILRGTASDAGGVVAKVQFQLDGQRSVDVPVVGNRFNFQQQITTDGSYLGELRVTDQAGNITVNRFQQTFSQLRRVQADVWMSDRIHIRDTWPSKDQLTRQIFADGRLFQAETWSFGSRVLEVWDSAGNQVRTTDARDTIVEVWTVAGGYRKETQRTDGSVLIESYDHGRKFQEELFRDGTRKEVHFERTMWDVNGDKSKQIFDLGKKVSEEYWSASGLHFVTTTKQVTTYLTDKVTGTVTTTVSAGRVVREEFVADNGTFSASTRADERGYYITHAFRNGKFFAELIRKPTSNLDDPYSSDYQLRRFNEDGSYSFVTDENRHQNVRSEYRTADGSYSTSFRDGPFKVTRTYAKNVPTYESAFDNNGSGYSKTYTNGLVTNYSVWKNQSVVMEEVTPLTGNGVRRIWTDQGDYIEEVFNKSDRRTLTKVERSAAGLERITEFDFYGSWQRTTRQNGVVKLFEVMGEDQTEYSRTIYQDGWTVTEDYKQGKLYRQQASFPAKGLICVSAFGGGNVTRYYYENNVHVGTESMPLATPTTPVNGTPQKTQFSIGGVLDQYIPDPPANPIQAIGNGISRAGTVVSKGWQDAYGSGANAIAKISDSLSKNALAVGKIDWSGVFANTTTFVNSLLQQLSFDPAKISADLKIDLGSSVFVGNGALAMPDFSSVANMAQIAQQRFEAFGGGFSQFINAGFSSVLKIGGDVADIYHKAILEPFNKELEHIRGIDWANPATYTNEINKLTPWKFVIVEGPAKGPVILDSRTQSTVDRFRNKPAGSDGPPGLYDFQEVTPQGTSAEEVRQAHLDERFLRLPNKDTGVYEKTNLIRAGGREAAEDYALKNGLALIAAAADGDQVHALAILQDLLKYGFDKNGEPIRLIPDTAELNERNRTKFYTDGGGVDSYSVDQFVSQLAGMHFAWKNGNDQVKAAAKALMAEWVRVLTENHGRLGPDDGRGTNQFDQMISVDRTPAGAVYGFPALPYLVEDVAREMGLNYSYGSVLTPAADAVGVLKDLVKEMIIEKLGRISWKMENKYAQAGFEITIPLEARRFVAEFAVKQITAAEQFANLYDHLNRALDQIPVQIDIFDWKQNVKEFLLSSIPFANFGMREVALYGMMRGGYDAITALYTTQGSTATATPGHLFFWEALLYGDLHPVGGTLLQAQKEAVHKATAQHRWYNYSLLAGDFAEPVDRLANWPKEWSSEFYLFKSNRAQQDEQFRGTDPAQPQLSYLVLHALGTIAGAVIRP